MRNWNRTDPDVRNLVVATDIARTVALTAAQAAADKLARDIVLLDVSDEVVITDIFMVASAPNERQVQAIVDSVEERLRKVHDVKPTRREGERGGRWVLLDYADVVVHVQHTEEREYYALDSLWKDCPSIEFVDAGQRGGQDRDGRQDAA
ncbi:ribosome-associated protein [Stackebrandtia albiflava]|uniref:Ribosomal silencing factor RsfS n=1 Tax=Stackebrandtia albiflava TaxID=406432 RepID=A0A562VGE5_9ACTN|nr:ribosome-associated protein [Stackebrandtia albiflava]